MLRKLLKKLRVNRGRQAKKEDRREDARQEWKEHHNTAAAAYDRFEKRSKRATALRKEAKKLRKDGKEKRADAVLAEAREAESNAAKALAHSQAEASLAQEAVAEVKRLTQEIEGLERTEAELEARIKKLRGGTKVKISGNKVTGGTPKKRLQVAALTSAKKCATGARHNFYSQRGLFTVEKLISGEPYGYRSDCSQWFTSCYWSCGLPDPNGGPYGGTTYTGSLVENGTPCTREYARNNPGCAVIFGAGPGHHVEMSVGDGTEHTVGHGSAPIDMGTFDLLPGPVRFYKFALS